MPDNVSEGKDRETDRPEAKLSDSRFLGRNKERVGQGISQVPAGQSHQFGQCLATVPAEGTWRQPSQITAPFLNVR